MTWMTWCCFPAEPAPAVVPVLIGPLQVLLAILPGLIVAVLGAVVSLLKPRAMLNLVKLLWRLKLPVAAIVLAGAGAVWAKRSLFPAGRGSVNAAEVAGVDWPVFRGDLARRGIGPAAGGRPGGQWMWKQPQQAFFASPAIVGNRVYIVSANMNPFGQSGTFYCFDADTGAVVWEGAPEGYRPTFSSPVISGNYLVCGEGLHDTRDARIVCLDTRDGKVLWTHRTGSHVECAPVIADGRVYVGAGDDGYYCLALEGEDGRAKVLWHADGKKYPDAETSLAVHDGKVYAGLGLGGMALCVLDGKTGEELHRLKMPYPVFGPPAIANGKLYVGMGNGDYVKEAEQLGVKPAGEVRCIDIARIGEAGYEHDWTFAVGRTVLGAVAVADGQVYFGSRDGFLHCVSDAGKLVGKWNAHAPIISAPAVTERHVYFVAKSGTLYALDRRTMEPAWEFALGKGGRADQPEFISSPAVTRGRVFVGSQYDGFFSVPEPAGTKAAPIWAGYMGGCGAAGNPEDSPLLEVADLHWKHAIEGMTAPAAALGNSIFVPVGGSKPGVICIDGTSSKAAQVRWSYITTNAVHASPAAAGEMAFVVDGKVGDAGRQVHAVDASTGSLKWKHPVEPAASGVMMATTGHLIVQDRPGVLACLDFAGKTIWSQPVEQMKHMPTATDSMLIVAEPHGLLVLDRPTGRVLWRVEMPLPRTAPVVSRMNIFIGTAKGVECRSLIDGSVREDWNAASPPVSSEIALSRNALVYTSDEGKLVILSRADGSVIRTLDDAVPGMPPVLSRNSLLFLHTEALMSVSLDETDLDPLPWADITHMTPTTPMIVSDSAVFFGTRAGLVRLGGVR